MAYTPGDYPLPISQLEHTKIRSSANMSAQMISGFQKWLDTQPTDPVLEAAWRNVVASHSLLGNSLAAAGLFVAPPPASPGPPSPHPLRPPPPTMPSPEDYHVFDIAPYLDEDKVLRQGLQVGGKIKSDGTLKSEGQMYVIDPRDFANKQALKVICSSGRYSIAPDRAATSAAFMSFGRGDSVHAGIDWVQFEEMDMHPGGYSMFIAAFNGAGTHAPTGNVLWFDDVRLFGTDFDSGQEVQFKFGANMYQTSLGMVNSSWAKCGLMQEHQEYIRGWARGFNDTPPFMFHQNCYFGRSGSQQSKGVSRPDTQSIIDSGFVPGDPTDMQNPFRAHNMGTPYVGGAIVQYINCDFEESGVANPPQRGPGGVILEGACIEELYFEGCYVKSPTLCVGLDATKMTYAYPPPQAAGRFYNPTSGKVSEWPGSQKITIVDSDFWSTQTSVYASIMRFIDVGDLTILNSSIQGFGKIGTKASGVIVIEDLNTPATIARANSKGVPLGLPQPLVIVKPPTTV